MQYYDKFMGLAVRLLEKLSAKFSPVPEGIRLKRLGYILIGVWFICWSLIPMIFLKGTFIDILENIVWGQHFQFGYDKNPYLGAWIGHAGYVLSGGGIWINYALSQVFVGIGLLMTWKLARRLLPEAEALLAMVFMLGINFYSLKAAELCDDVMELGFWPLTVYFFYCALKDSHKLRYWALTGLFAGCSFMVKYYGIVLFASMALVVVFTPEGRKSFKHAGIYVAGLIFAVMTLPNVLFLLQYDLVAIDYALRRSHVGGAGWWGHIKYPMRAIERILGVLAPSLVIFVLLFLARVRQTPKVQRNKFDSVFLNFMCWGPLGFTLLFSAVSGGKINYSWVLPCFALVGVYFFYYYRPLVRAFNFRAAVALILVAGTVFGVIFALRSTYHQGYKKRSSDYENFPGQAVAALVTTEWHKFAAKPLPYVIGERTEACHMTLFSPDRPKPYFSANPLYSNWINEEDLLKSGAAIVLPWPEEGMPTWYNKLKERGVPMTKLITVKTDRAVPDWFIGLMGKPPKQVAFSYCFILPQESDK